MILLFLSFLIGFAWYPLEDVRDMSAYEMVLNSEEGHSIIMQYGGKENLVKSSIPLGAGVFKGGEMVLLIKGLKIKRTPENLKLMKRAISMERYNRYSALYEEGELKAEWEELKRETESKLGISSLEEIPREELREFFPERILPTEEGFEREQGTLEKEGKEEIEYPAKSYFSFLLTEENGMERLRIVILHLSPIDELIEKITEEEGGER